MSVTVELTYDMAKALGVPRFEVDGADTVRDVVRAAEERFASSGESFERLTRVSAIAINGVLCTYRKGMKTRLTDGDRVAFVKAAAGG
jgi:molybdopterin converting factor small subunit